MRLLRAWPSCFPVQIQTIRHSSSMFGSRFKPVETKKSSNMKSILHLNVSHGDKSLVTEGAKLFLSQLKFQYSVHELSMWKEAPKIQYNLHHALAKMKILQNTASQKDEELFAPVLKAAELINQVDVVLISTPMWNYSVPYPLKQYIDTIVQPGVNFCDEDQSSIEHLKGRHLIVFSSAGAMYDHGSHVQDFLNPYLGQVFKLMGFDRQEIVFIQGTSVRSREDLVKYTHDNAVRVAANVNEAFCDSNDK